MKNEESPGLIRSMGRWTLTALVINSIIGSGIFGLPSVVAGYVGRLSPIAYLIAAAGMGVVIACFAEVASQFGAAGGPYLYAREAFGRMIGIEVGFLLCVVKVAVAAAAADLFTDYLVEFWPAAHEPVARLAVLAILIGFLAAVNVYGIKSGAAANNVFTVREAGAVDLLCDRWRRLRVVAPPGTSGRAAGRHIDASPELVCGSARINVSIRRVRGSRRTDGGSKEPPARCAVRPICGVGGGDHPILHNPVCCRRIASRRGFVRPPSGRCRARALGNRGLVADFSRGFDLCLWIFVRDDAPHPEVDFRVGREGRLPPRLRADSPALSHTLYFDTRLRGNPLVPGRRGQF